MFSAFLTVCSSGGQETEEWETSSASETWEPDEGPAAAVWFQHQRTSADAGLQHFFVLTCLSSFPLLFWLVNEAKLTLLSSVLNCIIWLIVLLPSEWEMSPADWAWDSEAEGAWRGAQSGAERMEGEASATEEGIQYIQLFRFSVHLIKPDHCNVNAVFSSPCQRLWLSRQAIRGRKKSVL